MDDSASFPLTLGLAVALPRSRIGWLGLAAFAGGHLAATAAGCHLVVGADDYQIEPDGQGAAGATSSSSTATGGGATTSGTGAQGGSATTAGGGGTGTTTSSSTSGTGGTTTTTSGSGGAGDCGSLGTCEQCLSCAVGDPCASQYAICMGNAECAAIYNCGMSCTTEACIQGCVAAHPSAQVQAGLLFVCMFDTVCGTACAYY